jgi:hypothetical protein
MRRPVWQRNASPRLRAWARGRTRATLHPRKHLCARPRTPRQRVPRFWNSKSMVIAFGARTGASSDAWRLTRWWGLSSDSSDCSRSPEALPVHTQSINHSPGTKHSQKTRAMNAEVLIYVCGQVMVTPQHLRKQQGAAAVTRDQWGIGWLTVGPSPRHCDRGGCCWPLAAAQPDPALACADPCSAQDRTAASSVTHTHTHTHKQNGGHRSRIEPTPRGPMRKHQRAATALRGALAIECVGAMGARGVEGGGGEVGHRAWRRQPTRAGSGRRQKAASSTRFIRSKRRQHDGTDTGAEPTYPHRQLVHHIEEHRDADQDLATAHTTRRRTKDS